MKKEFKERYGEWALITGASSGIGKALAFAIARKGLNIILVARRQGELEQTAAELEHEYEVSTLVVSADLSIPDEIQEVIRKVGSIKIGLLVLSAGIVNTGLFTKNDLQKELQVIELNIISTLALTHHFTKNMLERKQGGILFLSSVTGQIPSPYFANYAATKSYVLTLGTSLYGELNPRGIDISVLLPGVTDTPMSEQTGMDWSKTPIGHMKPEDVAEEAIKYFGKKLVIIPGRANKILAFLLQYIIPLKRAAQNNEKMVRKAINPHKL